MNKKPDKAPLIAFGLCGLIFIILIVYLFSNYDMSLHSGRIFSDLTRMEEPAEEMEHKVDEFLYGDRMPAR